MRCFILGIWVIGFAPLVAPVSADGPDYLTEVKPLLASRCFDCHGGLKQKAKLRVDTAAAMLESKSVIPTKPDESELLYRISTDDPDDRMPPEHEGSLFTAEEVEIIRAWIQAGAAAPKDEKPELSPEEHWAFQRIEKPVPPSDGNPIDAFLAAKQAAHGLKPQPGAARGILLRRLYLDLIGLPPNAGQLASEEPFEAIVDQLLASPHHGERWGRHWMDVWRYSDWYGLGAQLRVSQKHLWHWRDWIVNSVNTDKGYDRMIYEMLAGDELEPENPDVVAGTGFLARNYYLFNRTTWLDNTIEHTGKAFLGLTMNCAKCHDHKYDPVSQLDYYRFRAIFEPHQIRLDAVPGQTDFEKNGLPRAFDDHLDAETFLHVRGNPADPDKRRKITPGVPKTLASFVKEPEPISLPVSAWAPGTRDYVQRDQLAAAETKLQSARRNLDAAKQKPIAPAKPTNSGSSLEDDFSQERPEIWEIVGQGWRYQGGSLVQLETTRQKQFARSRNPHPSDFDLTLKFRTTGGNIYKSVGIRFDVADNGQNAHTVYASAHAPDPKVQIAHTVGGKVSYPPSGRVSRPIRTNADYELRVQTRGQLVNVSLDGEFLLAYQLPQRNTGSVELFAFDATAEFDSISISPLSVETELKPAGSNAKAPTADPAVALELAEAKVAEAKAALAALKARIAADNATILGIEGGSPEEAARLTRQHAVSAARVELLSADGGKADAARKKLAAAEKALELTDANYASLRGSFKALETPEHKEPHYAATYAKTSSGRRTALAEWLTSRENPLTARVAVNHIWLRHFGEPLVETVFDFGRRAPIPEHLDLLDYLAVELIESGWSMKHLHRLIVTSETWRRSSSNLHADPSTLAKDPTNRFYWRMNSRRMESQAIRDSLLSLAGELDLNMGGPSIDPKPEARRRGIYFKHSRDQQSLLLATFDDAEILACYRRSESIVPQQALALANGKVAMEMSEKLGKADWTMAELFEQILCRPPTEAELAECTQFLREVPNRARLVHALFNHNDFVTIR